MVDQEAFEIRKLDLRRCLQFRKPLEAIKFLAGPSDLVLSFLSEPVRYSLAVLGSDHRPETCSIAFLSFGSMVMRYSPHMH